MNATHLKIGRKIDRKIIGSVGMVRRDSVQVCVIIVIRIISHVITSRLQLQRILIKKLQ